MARNTVIDDGKSYYSYKSSIAVGYLGMVVPRGKNEIGVLASSATKEGQQEIATGVKTANLIERGIGGNH